MSFIPDPGRVPGAVRLADELAIQRVLAAHCRGVDRADEACLKACYWPDATVAYGSFNGGAHEFCGVLPQAIRGYRHTQHTISNCLIDFDAGANPAFARSETYVTAYHYRSGEPDEEMVFFGRYLDQLARRGDEWKIVRRQVVMDWNRLGPGASKDDGPPFDGLARGGRAPDDPLYTLLGNGNPES